MAYSFQEVQSLIAAGKVVLPISLRVAEYYGRPDTAIVPVDKALPVEYGFTWLATADTAKVRSFGRTVLDVAEHEALDLL